MSTPPFTQSQLRAELDYDPLLGTFRRRIARCNKVKVGDLAGSFDTHGHVQIRIWGKLYLAHRLAVFYMAGEWPPMVDHRDTIRNNNSWGNLRVADRVQNSANRRCKKTSRTGMKNLTARASGRFRVRMTIDGKRVNIGTFDTEEAAISAHRVHATMAHGEFARVV